VALVVVVGLIAGTTGCVPQQRYRLLSLFFDGVPPPSSTKEVAGQTISPEARAAKFREARERHRREAAAHIFRHGPYASKHCPACHQSQKASAMFIPGRHGPSHGPTFGPKLRYAKKDLCRHCHARFRPQVLARRQRFTHGPVAAGTCLRCHNPHQTPNPYMIRVRPISKICLQCHRAEEVYAASYHQEEAKGRDCTDCHNPHGGDRPYFLRQPPPLPKGAVPSGRGGVARAAGAGRWG